MGGVFGHMSHIYDNPSMTFGQIKDIMTKASAGQLENVTEKTDGQNLFVSYKISDGTQRWVPEEAVRSARNKGDIKNGGMTPQQLATKFAGRGALEAAFTNAFRAFAKTVDKFSEEEKLKLFGPDTNIYYNAEVMDPANANVINYDTKTFLIHRAGHAEYDRETGKPVDKEEGFSEQQASTLQSVLEKSQDEMSKGDFRVQVNAIRQLQALSDDTALSTALKRMDQVMSSAGVSDGDTIGDYIIGKWRQVVNQELPDLSDEGKQLIIKRVMTDYYGALEGEGPLKSRGLETRQITKTIGRADLNKQIVSVIKSYPQRFKEFIFPVESVIHRFAIEIMRAVQSAYIIAAGGNEKEVARLQALVGKAIETIQASGSDEAMEILRPQLEKLSKIEDDGSIGSVDLSMISSAAEGIVFDYDGHTYKFTGGFAPANQILGLFKYGRKGIPAMAGEEDLEEGLWNSLKGAKDKVMNGIGQIKNLMEDEEAQTIAAVAGGFKPPHRGHMEMIAHYANIADKVKLFIGKSPRPIKGDKSNRSITAEQSAVIWDQYLADAGLADRVDIEVISGSPMKASYSVLEDALPGQTILMGCGQKDTYFTPDAIAKYAPEGVQAKAAPCPNILDPNTKKPYSATAVRDTIKNNDLESFTKFLPKESLKKAPEIFALLGGSLQEMSSAGGAAPAVSGASSRSPEVVGSEEEEEHKKDFLSEEELVTEVMDYLLGISVG
jgi:hypothetical protein